MKISHSTLGKNGRLGNQLFQVMSTMGLADKHSAQASFPAWEYEKYFTTPIPHVEMVTDFQVKEKFYHYHEWDIPQDADLLGYLQSEKYFGEFRLKFDPVLLAQMRLQNDIFHRETICIQVRRGDYVGNPNYHQLPAEYYMHALITHFPNYRDFNLLFISDDIEYCRTHFESLPNSFFSTENSDIEDMALASLCDNFIISNSSFGWFCAWFGEKPYSKIVHSGHMFAGALARKHDPKDYRPLRWTGHRRENYKLPLSDVTFTIPVFYDHASRKENLDLSLHFLLQSLDTKITVCEQGGSAFDYTQQWADYFKVDYPEFHRTRMLNDMAKRAETPYLVNWDCDVIIPPAQLYMAVEELRDGADMVYPYDGRFARMARNPWLVTLQNKLDIGIVGSEMFKGREPEHSSVGGAVMFNRDSFQDGGMENENMISFGPEDVERFERFNRLGYDIRRVDGTLFHLNHFVGDNSSPRNPHFDENHKELDRIRRMSKGQLRDYIDTWEWRHQYTNLYYQDISQGAILSAKIVFPLLPSQPASVIDVGCGVGEWRNGIRDYVGIDYRVPRENLLVPADRFKECNLNLEFPRLGRKFDLCLCLEVAEHLKPSRAAPLVEYLCSLSDTVLFSASIPFQGGQGHVNERFQSYWGDLFRLHGFGGIYLPQVRSHPDVELWYRQNMILYEKRPDFLNYGVADFVLPEYYLQIVKGLQNEK